MASIFGEDVEPSAFEIAMQQLFLSGLSRRVSETNDFSGAVDATLGFKRDEFGTLVPLTDEERFDTLDPASQDTFNLLKQQSQRLETALTGDLPVSERLRQRSKEQFDILKEEQGRRGNTVAGTDLDTAVGFSTPAIQSIGERQRTQGLLEDEERRGEIDKGFGNLFNVQGLLSDIDQRQFSNLVSAPSRFDIGQGGGLLKSDSAQSLFNAGRDPTGGLGGILGDITKTAAGEFFKSVFNPITP